MSKYLGHSLLRVPWGKLYKISLINDLRFNERVRIGEDVLFVLSYLNRVQSITILPMESEKCNSMYIYYELSMEETYKKYPLSVKEATFALVTINDAYEKLNIHCPDFERFMPNFYFELCKNDISRGYRDWYENPQIRKICIRKSLSSGIMEKMRIHFLFLPGFYRLLRILHIK